eukprot:4082829-Pyramimonas_sp.AAC.1
MARKSLAGAPSLRGPRAHVTNPNGPSKPCRFRHPWTLEAWPWREFQWTPPFVSEQRGSACKHANIAAAHILQRQQRCYRRGAGDTRRVTAAGMYRNL